MSRKTMSRAFGVLLGLASGGIVTAQELVLAHGEETEIAEHVWSGYQDTWVENDGVSQSLSEAISGGKRNQRRSRLIHDWLFDVPAASGVTLLLRAARTPDRENFVFFASIDGGQSYQPLPEIYVQSSGMTSFEAPLPSVPAGGGLIRIRVEDEQSAEWQTTSDSVHVDYLALRVAPPGPPAAPTGVVASSKSPSTMFVGWTDALDEDGYRIERFDGVSWTLAGQTGADGTFFVDEGLAPSTTYGYRVIAFSAQGDSAPSDAGTGTTRAIGAFSAEYVSDGGGGWPPTAHHVDAAGRVRVAWQAGLELWYAERDPIAGTWHREVVAQDASRFSLAVSPNGTFGLAYRDRSSRDLYFAERDPIVGTWNAEVVASSVGGFSFAMSPDGRFGLTYVAYVGGDYGDLLFVEQRPGTAGWELPVLVHSGDLSVSENGLQYDAQGQPAITYTRVANLRKLQEVDIWFAQRAGGSWRTKLVEASRWGARLPALAIDGAGRPVIVYRLWLELSNKWDVRTIVGITRWVDDPATGAWEDATWQYEVIDPGTGNVDAVQLVIDPISGTEMVAFSAGVVYVARHSAGGWSIEEVATGSLGSSGRNLAVDSGGTAHLAFVTPAYALMLATDAAGTWSSVVVDPYAAEPGLCLDDTGAASIVHIAELFPGGPVATFFSHR